MVNMAAMSTRSMFGDQVYSKRRSAPAFGFGSSTRAQAGKVFMSQEHAKLATPGFSPGPSAYTLRASVGAQVDGSKRSSPMWIFGTAERFSVAKRADANPGARRRRRSRRPRAPLPRRTGLGGWSLARPLLLAAFLPPDPTGFSPPRPAHNTPFAPSPLLLPPPPRPTQARARTASPPASARRSAAARTRSRSTGSARPRASTWPKCL